jgi:dipeptidase E
LLLDRKPIRYRSICQLHNRLFNGVVPTPRENNQALDLRPFEFFPHLGKDVRYLTQVIAYSRDSGRPILACPDGDGVVVADELVRPIGAVLMVQNGKVAPAVPTALDDVRRPEVS